MRVAGLKAGVQVAVKAVEFAAERVSYPVCSVGVIGYTFWCCKLNGRLSVPANANRNRAVLLPEFG